MKTRKIASKADLAEGLAVEIRAVHRLLQMRVREEGRGNVGGGGLTTAQESVLVRLEKDGAATVSSLARAEGMRPQSMREMVAPLVESGFVMGVPDLFDARQTLMSVTPEGRKWIRQRRAVNKDWLAGNISQKLSSHEQQKLVAMMALLRRVVAG